MYRYSFYTRSTSDFKSSSINANITAITIVTVVRKLLFLFLTQMTQRHFITTILLIMKIVIMINFFTSYAFAVERPEYANISNNTYPWFNLKCSHHSFAINWYVVICLGLENSKSDKISIFNYKHIVFGGN